MSAKTPNPKDQRVQRTDQRLRQAFIALVHERGYEAVTIRDVAQRAGVGRSTFYTHFGDLEELHDRWLKDFSAESTKTRPLLDFARSFLEHARSQKGSWHGLGRKKNGTVLQKRFRQHLLALAREEVKQIVPRQRPAVAEAVSRYVAGASAEVIFWWMGAPTNLSTAEIAELLQQLTTRGCDSMQHLPPPAGGVANRR